MDLNKLKKYIKEQMEDAWNKMGDTGNFNYDITSTKEENFYAGKYVTLESICDIIDNFDKDNSCK